MQKLTELAPQLWPLLAPRVNATVQAAINASLNSGLSSLTPSSPPAVGAMQIHDLDSTWHSGTLADSQAPQFLMVDGSRALAGNMAVNPGITIDGIDISVHAADPDAHHDRATAYPPLSIVGQQVLLSYTNGLETVANQLQVKRATNSGLDIASTALTLGTPIISSVASTNTVTGTQHSHAVDWSSGPGAASKLLGTDTSGYLSLVRLILSDRVRTNLVDTVSGALTLQAVSQVVLDPTTDVVLEPGSNLVKLQPGVNLQSHNYASQITGVRVTNDGQGDFRYLYADEMHVKNFIADLEQALAGGQIISKSVAVLGVNFSAPPASAATVTYRHHTTTTSTGPDITGTKPTGTVQYDFLIAHLVFSASRTVSTAPSGWSLLGEKSDLHDTLSRVYYKIAGDSEPSSYTWTLSGTGNFLLTVTGYSGVDQVSPVNTWANNTQGLNGIINTPTVTTTVANVKHAWFAGNIEVGMGTVTAVPSSGLTERADYQLGSDGWSYYGEASQAAAGVSSVYYADWTGNHYGTCWIVSLAPAPANVTSLIVKDLPSASNMAVFQANDIVRLRTFSRSGGSLTVADCWGVVTAYVDGTGSNGIDEGMQRWTFTRSGAPNAGTMAAGTVVNKDAIVLDYGVSGNGYYEVNAIDGMYGANSPYWQIVTWSGHPATGQTVRTRGGNLYGIFSVANEYGIYAGSGTADTNSYLRISNNTIKFNNIPLSMWNGATQTMNLNATGTDFWIGLTSGDKRLAWDGSTLTVKGAIVVQAGSSGYANITDKPTSLSGINSGEGTKLSGIAAGATVGATWNVNMTPPARFGDSPAGAGLYLTASNMGYWDGGNWKVWIDSSGNFYFGGATGASIRWNGSVLSGYDSGNGQQWYAGSTDGVIRFGGVNGWLGAAGIKLKAITTEPGNSATSIAWNETLPTTDAVSEIYSWVTTWNELVAVARNKSTTRGARTRIGNSINNVFSAGMRTTSTYTGVWNHGMDFYGLATFNDRISCSDYISAVAHITAGTYLTAGSYISATTSLNAATLELTNSAAYMGSFNQGSNGSGYGYFNFNYNSARMGFLLWRDAYVQLQAESRYLYLDGTRVGIKTGSPSYDFDVAGEARITGTIRSDVALSLNPQGSAPGASAVYYVLYVDSADGKLKYRIPSGSGGTIRTLTYT